MADDAEEDGKAERGGRVAEKGSRKPRATPVSRSARAGLQFPVGRIHRHLKKEIRGHKRIAGTAATEVLELAGYASKDLNVRRMTPRHLQLAIRGDEELDRLVKATISGGGVIPHIHKSLMPLTQNEQKARNSPPAGNI